MKINNPYLNSANSIWVRGNLHTHTSISDGAFSPQDTITRYASLGYQFLMFSEHDLIAPANGLDTKGMVIIQGNEITDEGPHLLHVNAKKKVEPYSDRQKVLDEIQKDSGFAIISHPNWEEDFNHCPQEFLETWEHYTGIEIYNGIVRRLPGNPCATDRWDLLLSQGKFVWGYANDDAHWDENFGVAWNVAQVEKLTLENVLNALKNGNFYTSTGVEIEKITVNSNTISLTTSNAKKIAVIVDYGRRIKEVQGNSICYEISDTFPYSYIRFECWGEGESQAWTQPFRLV